MPANALALTSTNLSLAENKKLQSLQEWLRLNYAATASIDLHSAAHLRQASAHSLQCFMSECFSHSVAQALQASSHFLKRTSRFESVLLAATKALQASAQAMQSFSECSIPTLPLFSVEQVSHASAHVSQASMQFSIFLFSIIL